MNDQKRAIFITYIRKVIFNIPILFCLAILCSGCSSSLPSSKPVTKTGFFFNTVITVTIYNENSEDLLEECFKLAKKYEDLFSATTSFSDVSKINQSKGAPVTVSDETLTLLKKGLEYCELSEGGFDLTIGKLSSLWNFSENEGTLPSADEIDAAVSTIDYHGIVISGNTVYLKNTDAAIDLGAIAKGYIADRMKDFLNENGVTNGTINLGGNVLCLGPKKDGSNYRIGIQKPFDEHGTLSAVVEVKDMTVVSSGIYERYITVNDEIYHHILNPSTGYPYENNLLGVTIICKNSVDGDGLSTTCFSLGLEKGLELIENLPDTEAVFITDDYNFHMTSGIGDTVPFEKMQ